MRDLSATLSRTATAQPVGRVPAGSPPRPAMRMSRMASAWATRSDCCMSEMLLCTCDSLLLKSNRASTPNRMMTVTNSEMVTSTRVKPRSRPTLFSSVSLMAGLMAGTWYLRTAGSSAE